MAQHIDQELAVLTALQAAPLDRLRLMKTLFLSWHRRQRPADGPFLFVPYLYGPCAFDVYSTLARLEAQGSIVQAPHAVSQRGRYYLTKAGRSRLAGEVDAKGPRAQSLQEIARWAAASDFTSLLRSVYSEAPDFASRSLVASDVLAS